jgi:hypothetical protein
LIYSLGIVRQVRSFKAKNEGMKRWNKTRNDSQDERAIGSCGGKVSRQKIVPPTSFKNKRWGKCENQCHVELRQNLVGATWEGSSSSSLRFVYKASTSQTASFCIAR